MRTWGIDPGLRKCHLAVIEDGKLVDSYAYEGQEEDLSAALAALHIGTVSMAVSAWASHGTPDAIVVEQPSGTFDNLPLKYATGVILAAAAKYGYATTLTSGQWRKIAFGNGGMKSAAAKAAAVELAKTLGYNGSSEDTAEAICLALAASMETTKCS